MTLTRFLTPILAGALSLSLLPSAAAAAQGSSGEVVSAALSQLGYTEEEDEYTKYGQWYGIPTGYWCDMFVSWCADQAQVPEEIFPHSATCTGHVESFTELGRYMPSSALGGDYLPQQGDLLFFYDPAEPEIQTHVGIVLYAENGYVYTIEGNALANRLDCPPDQLAALREEFSQLEPPDYVTVNAYPLDHPLIHGYAVPDYADRQLLALEGFVDLGRHAPLRGQFTRLAKEGLMSPTSSHTFSPNHGMRRGEFLQSVMTLCGLYGWNETTLPFSDVSEESPWYPAVMTARCAGIIQGTGNNTFRPEAYISGAAAQTILFNALSYLGLEDRVFTFSPGDLAFICGTYTPRADLAKALYALRTDIPLPAPYAAAITLDGEALSWSPVHINGTCYISLEELQQTFPGLEAPSDTPAPETANPGEASETEEASPSMLIDPSTGLPIPLAACSRVIPSAETCTYRGSSADINSFTWEDRRYLALREAAGLLDLALTWDGAAFSIALATTAN